MTLEELVELNRLNECAYECTRQSRWKQNTQRYLNNLLPNNIKLQDEILNGKYKVSPTINFTINERGHIRKIEAPAIRDRIVQKTLTKNILIPALTPYLIYDNYASLKYRGTSFARKRLEMMLKRYVKVNGLDGYILLVDIKKYFESIDHEVLKQLIISRIADQPQNVIDLIYYIIDYSSDSNKGLNLGSEAPQILAVYYLNNVDTFIKIVNGIKYYGRYMDDIFIMSNSKEQLRHLLKGIIKKLAELKLQINEKKTHIVKLKHGFTYLQVKYNILSNGKILKRISHNKIVRERRRLKAFRRMVDEGRMTIMDVQNCYKSWKGTATIDHNACTKTIRSMDKLYKQLFGEFQQIERDGRSKLCTNAYKNADTTDLNTLFKF